MDHNNANFKLNPAGFLGRKAVECYNNGKSITGDSLAEKMKSIGSNTQLRQYKGVLEFDFVPVKGMANMVSLLVMGPQGTYASTGRRGSPVVACWMPYMGQSVCDVGRFGYIAESDVPGGVNYIFTVGLGGCTVVAADQGSKGLHFYHEPTDGTWSSAPTYPDGNNVIARAQPSTIAGFAVMQRDNSSPHGWTIHVQDINGTSPSSVTSVPV